MSDLKPCAHCGGTAQKIVAPFGFAIECEECGAQSNYRDSVTAAIEAWNRRTQPEATKPAQDESDEDTWRRLALQFDGHRMMALSHLRAMLQDAQKHAPLVEAFLKAPPMGGETVLAQRIAALASPADALVAVDRVDAERYRWLRDKARSVDWTRNLSPNSYTTACRNSANQMDTAIDAAMREQP